MFFPLFSSSIATPTIIIIGTPVAAYSNSLDKPPVFCGGGVKVDNEDVGVVSGKADELGSLVGRSTGVGDGGGVRDGAARGCSLRL